MASIDAGLYIVGLGPGNPDDLSKGALEALRSADKVILRTAVHPTVDYLRHEGILFSSCDDAYESAGSFDEVYSAIAERVIQAVLSGGIVVYAVPGHPSVFESTTGMLRARCKEIGTRCRIIGSQSFIEPTFALLDVDPSQGVVIIDALKINETALNPEKPLLIAQVYDREVASTVKLVLLDLYGDDHEVTVVRAAGVAGLERTETMALPDLDRTASFDHLTSVYVPATRKPVLGQDTSTCAFPLDPLTSVVAELRSERGCPWDREQDHMSLRPFVLEEAYEVAEAIELGEMHKLCEELGDLLLQIALHSEIATESGSFNINNVVDGITRKMIRRHPHVFSDGTARTSEEVLERWQIIKQQEKGQKPLSVLGDIPKHLPALMRAHKVQSKAAKVGFDWNDAAEVVTKVLEEVGELNAARSGQDHMAIESEVGDLLFAVVNLSRHLSVDPEVALSSAVNKFARRFRYVEDNARASGKELKHMTLAEMDELWNKAKRAGL